MRVITVIIGILMVLVGLVCAIHPVLSAIALGRFIGILLILGAISIIVSVFKRERSYFGIIFFVLLLLGGVSLICSDLNAIAAVNTLAIFFAVIILIGGILQIIISIYTKGIFMNWWIALISGILNTVVAFIIIVSPFTGFMLVDMMFALEIIISGITAIAFGLGKRESK